MKRAHGMHVEWVGDEAVILEEATGQLHYLNPPAALLLALVEEDGYEAAVSSLIERFGDISADIEALTKDMVDKGILVDG